MRIFSNYNKKNMRKKAGVVGPIACLREFEITLQANQVQTFLDSVLKISEGRKNLEEVLNLDVEGEEFETLFNTAWLLVSEKVTMTIGGMQHNGDFQSLLTFFDLLKSSNMDLTLKGTAHISYQPCLVEKYYEWVPGPERKTLAWFWILAEFLLLTPNKALIKKDENSLKDETLLFAGDHGYTDFVRLLTYAVAHLGFLLEEPVKQNKVNRKHVQ